MVPVSANDPYFTRHEPRVLQAYANRPLGDVGPRISVVVLPFLCGQYRIRVWVDQTGSMKEPPIVAEI